MPNIKFISQINRYVPVFIALALAATITTGCKEEKSKKSAFGTTLDCGDGRYRVSHPKECVGYDRLFKVTKEQADLMKRLSE